MVAATRILINEIIELIFLKNCTSNYLIRSCKDRSNMKLFYSHSIRLCQRRLALHVYVVKEIIFNFCKQLFFDNNQVINDITCAKINIWLQVGYRIKT